MENFVVSAPLSGARTAVAMVFDDEFNRTISGTALVNRNIDTYLAALPPSSDVAVTDEMVEVACAAHWVEPWPGDRSQPALKSARINMRAALEAALAQEGSDNG